MSFFIDIVKRLPSDGFMNFMNAINVALFFKPSAAFGTNVAVMLHRES